VSFSLIVFKSDKKHVERDLQKKEKVAKYTAQKYFGQIKAMANTGGNYS